MSLPVITRELELEQDTASTSAARGGVATAVDLQAESFDSLAFRRTMGRFATGVTVVTMLAPEVAGAGSPESALERPFGITVNAFMSVSLEPTLIAISIDKKAHAHATLLGAERFAVSVLAEDQIHLSDHFAGRLVDPLLEPYVPMAGFPVIEGAVAQIVCRRHQAFDAGDHTIFLGEVQALRQTDSRPLIFHAGRYDRLG